MWNLIALTILIVSVVFWLGMALIFGTLSLFVYGLEPGFGILLFVLAPIVLVLAALSLWWRRPAAALLFLCGSWLTFVGLFVYAGYSGG